MGHSVDHLIQPEIAQKPSNRLAKIDYNILQTVRQWIMTMLAILRLFILPQLVKFTCALHLKHVDKQNPSLPKVVFLATTKKS